MLAYLFLYSDTEENWDKSKWKPINYLQWNSNRKCFLFPAPDNSLQVISIVKKYVSTKSTETGNNFGGIVSSFFVSTV